MTKTKSELDPDELVRQLRLLALQGAGLGMLIDHVHEARGVEKYSRGVLLVPFRLAFGLSVRELHSLFGSQEFGDGATGRLSDIEDSLMSKIRRSVAESTPR